MIAPLDLVVVMPIFNEEANIGPVLREWIGQLERLKISFSILAVNDGSRDGTGDKLNELAALYPGKVRAIEKANSGHGRACRTGYDLAVASGGSWVLQIDSDGQCDPHFFPAFWKGRPEAECLFGVRTSRDDGAVRGLISNICRLVVSMRCGVDLKDANIPYRLIQATVLGQALRRIPGDFDMQNVALTVALRRDLGLRWKFIPIHFRARQGGINSIHVPRILSMGWNLLVELPRIK